MAKIIRVMSDPMIQQVNNTLDAPGVTRIYRT